MAKTNPSTKSNGASYKGIPAADREQVKELLQAGRNLTGRTPREAYQQIIRQREFTTQRKLEEQQKGRELIEKRRAIVVDEACEAFDRSLNNLAYARDLLDEMEKGTFKMGESSTDAETMAHFARVSLIESCRDIEQALCNLGHVKAGKYKGRFTHDGHLTSYMPRQPQEVKTASATSATSAANRAST